MENKNPPRAAAGSEMESGARNTPMALLLPRALLVAIRLQSLPALVLVHLQTTLLFQVAHGDKAPCGRATAL